MSQRRKRDDWTRYGITRAQGRHELMVREMVASAVHVHLATGLPLAKLLPAEYRYLRHSIEGALARRRAT